MNKFKSGFSLLFVQRKIFQSNDSSINEKFNSFLDGFSFIFYNNLTKRKKKKRGKNKYLIVYEFSHK